MAPPDKVTPEQKKFLVKLINAYLEAQKKGRHDKFWLELFGAWFQQWPEGEDTSIEDAEERATALSALVKEKKAYLKRWYQNHANKKSRANPYGRLIKQTLDKHTEKPKRRPQMVQLYCKLYYARRIKPLVRAEMRRLTILKGVKPSRGVFLRLLRKISEAVFKLEDDSIKDAVSKEFERREKEREDEAEDTNTLSSYVAAIEQIPIHFDSFAELLGSLTGWKFTLLAGGPDPLNAGQIRTISVHHGTNYAGVAFSDATPNFSERITDPYGTFLDSVYTPAECASRALFPEVVGTSPTHTAMTVAGDTPVVPATPEALPIVPAVLAPAATAPIPPVAPVLGDYDYEFSWNELNLLDPLEPLEPLDSLDDNASGNGATPYGEFSSFSEQLMTPLPDDMYNQLLTGPIGPNVPFTPTVASSLAARITLPATPNLGGLATFTPSAGNPTTCTASPNAGGLTDDAATSLVDRLAVQVTQPAAATPNAGGLTDDAATSLVDRLAVQVTQPAAATPNAGGLAVDAANAATSLVDRLAVQVTQPAAATPNAGGLAVDAANAATSLVDRLAVQVTQPAAATPNAERLDVDAAAFPDAGALAVDRLAVQVTQPAAATPIAGGLTVDAATSPDAATPPMEPTAQPSTPNPAPTTTSGTTSSLAKATKKKRSRDEANEAFIVTGKRVRIVQKRTEVEALTAAKGKKKENRAPKA